MESTHSAVAHLMTPTHSASATALKETKANSKNLPAVPELVRQDHLSPLVVGTSNRQVLCPASEEVESVLMARAMEKGQNKNEDLARILSSRLR